MQQRFPDYSFGQIALAQEQIDGGDHDAANDLAKLVERPRLHISEFAAIGACYVRLATAVGDIREARMWLKRTAEVYLDYSELPVLRKSSSWPSKSKPSRDLAVRLAAGNNGEGSDG